MGKKRVVRKSTSTTNEERPGSRATAEAQPPSPPQPQQTPTPEIPAVVQLDRLTAFLRKQDPNRDWAAELANFYLTEGVPTMPTPTPIQSTPAPGKYSPTVAAPSASSKLTPTHPQTEPLDVSPLSAYQDPNMGETEEKESEEEEIEREEDVEGEKENEEEKQTDEGKEKSKGKPVEETAPQTEEHEQLDLNETARKQGLTTDDEFQSLMEGRSTGEEDTVQMAEGLDLASGVIGTEEKSGKSGEAEGAPPQSEKEAVEKQPQEGATSQSEGREVEKNQSEEERPGSKTLSQKQGRARNRTTRKGG